MRERALAFDHGAQAAVCDVIRPWEHGAVLRATRYPTYYDFNLVRVEDDPPMSAGEIAAFADESLAGLRHRRVNVEDIGAAERLRPGFQALGWRTSRLVFMRHEQPPPPGPDVDVEEVPYDAVHDLRVAWHEEDFPGVDAGDHYAEAREVSLRRNPLVLAVLEAGAPIAFAQLEYEGDDAEIAQVFVHPRYRGGGRGTAMTRAAILAAGDAGDLWIVADDEDRPKELYRRLGFRPVWTRMEFTRLP